MQLRVVLLLDISPNPLVQTETTARMLKAENLVPQKSSAAKGGKKGAVQVASLPKMAVGRPLLLGKDLDTCVQDQLYH